MSRSCATAASLRPACPADAGRLAELAAQGFADPWSAGSFAEALAAAETRAWVATLDGRSVAYALARRVLDEAELLSLAVEAASQGRGLGRALLLRLLGELASEGVRRLHLEVRASNAPARALYARLGMRPVGLRPGYYADGEAAVLYGAAL